MTFHQVREAADAIAAQTGVPEHDVAVVLGSGVGDFATILDDPVEVPYQAIPNFPIPAAQGHAGVIYSTRMGANRVLVYSGRVHAYEGHAPATVVLPVRAAIVAGCKTVVLTNACGGIASGLSAGDIAVIKDHINMAGLSPLVGPNEEQFGPRFPDMTTAYSPRLREIAAAVATEHGMELSEQVYAWWLGPAFETPAEINMLRTLGADLVGMSTVPEVLAARHMGAETVALSVITNLAAGVTGEPLSAEEVLETARRVAPRFQQLLVGLLSRADLARSQD